MEGIIDHRTDVHAVAPAEIYIKHGSNKKVRKTTKGWHLCVEWKDGTTSWERLADLKESNPVEVAEYSATKSLLNTPAFVWWDIEVPKIWDDCVKLDKENDNTLWQDAVRKEMKNFRIVFKILNGE
jgi:hypothetical protein